MQLVVQFIIKGCPDSLGKCETALSMKEIIVDSMLMKSLYYLIKARSEILSWE